MTSMELLRPESDLARQFDSASRIDLLLACDDNQSPDGLLGYLDYPDDDSIDDRPDDELLTAAARFGPKLYLHRLGLRPPLDLRVEADLIAALSELIGFDPEPDVYCLAPVQTSSNPNQVVLDRAIHRIVQVYGVPLLRYRCLEFFVVGEG